MQESCFVNDKTRATYKNCRRSPIRHGLLFLLNLRSFKYNCFVRIPNTFTQNFAYAPALSSTKLGEFFTISGKIAPGGRKDFGFPRLAKLGMK